MGERGYYDINPKPKPNYLSFICTLLVFLCLLILIYVLSVYLKTKPAETGQGGNALGQYQGTTNNPFLPTRKITYSTTIQPVTTSNTIQHGTTKISDVTTIRPSENSTSTAAFTTAPTTLRPYTNQTSPTPEIKVSAASKTTTIPVTKVTQGTTSGPITPAVLIVTNVTSHTDSENTTSSEASTTSVVTTIAHNDDLKNASTSESTVPTNLVNETHYLPEDSGNTTSSENTSVVTTIATNDDFKNISTSESTVPASSAANTLYPLAGSENTTSAENTVSTTSVVTTILPLDHHKNSSTAEITVSTTPVLTTIASNGDFTNVSISESTDNANSDAPGLENTSSERTVSITSVVTSATPSNDLTNASISDSTVSDTLVTKIFYPLGGYENTTSPETTVSTTSVVTTTVPNDDLKNVSTSESTVPASSEANIFYPLVDSENTTSAGTTDSSTSQVTSIAPNEDLQNSSTSETIVTAGSDANTLYRLAGSENTTTSEKTFTTNENAYSSFSTTSVVTTVDPSDFKNFSTSESTVPASSEANILHSLAGSENTTSAENTVSTTSVETTILPLDDHKYSSTSETTVPASSEANSLYLLAGSESTTISEKTVPSTSSLTTIPHNEDFTSASISESTGTSSATNTLSSLTDFGNTITSEKTASTTTSVLTTIPPYVDLITSWTSDSTVPATSASTSIRSTVRDTTTPEPAVTTPHWVNFIQLRHDLQNPEKSQYCSSSICKRFASEMLAVVNHDKNPCLDFYDFACGGVALDEESYKSTLLDKILQNMANAPRDFRKFFRSCEQYDSDFSGIDRSLIPVIPGSTSELVADMILYQTMQFFDIGLKFRDDGKVQFVVTALQNHNLQTTLSRWSMIENFRKQCEYSTTVYIQSTASISPEEVEAVRHKIGECIERKIRTYTDKYIQNINGTYTSDDVEQLENIVKEHTKLIRDPNVLRYNTIREMTIDEFSYNYPLKDVDWLAVFTKLSNRVDKETNIQVQHVEYLDQLFKKLENINLLQVLQLWHHAQIYHNIVREKTLHTDHYCLDIALEFFPDVATSLIYKQFDVTKNNATIRYYFDDLKTNLMNSLTDLVTDTSFKGRLQSKLKKVTLVEPSMPKNIRDYYKILNINDKEFLENKKKLLKNYRMRLFSFEGRGYDDVEFIFQYFMSPFEFKPRGFYPLGKIVYHPAFVRDISTNIPKYVTLAKIGYPLAIELFKAFADDFKTYPYFDDLRNSQLEYDNATDYGLDDKNSFSVINDLILENGAFRLLTDVFDEGNYTTSIIFANQTFTIKKMFTIFAAQGYCKKGLSEEKVIYFTSTIPSKLKIKNTAINSKFVDRAFGCEQTHGFYGQFPHNGDIGFSKKR